jgi:hypothetical protein
MHNQITAGQLAIALNNLKDALDRYGYTLVTSVELTLRTDKDGESYITASAMLADGFQSDLEWNKKVQHGYTAFSLSDDGSHFVIPSNFLSREQRELHVMIGRMGQTKDFLVKMQSAAAKEYLDRLTAEMSQYELLAAPKA